MSKSNSTSWTRYRRLVGQTRVELSKDEYGLLGESVNQARSLNKLLMDVSESKEVTDWDLLRVLRFENAEFREPVKLSNNKLIQVTETVREFINRANKDAG